MSRGETETEGDTESETGCQPRAHCGLKLMNYEIMT